MENRPNREESAHPTRRTLEDEFADGNLNMVGTPDPDRYYHVKNMTNHGIERLKRRGYRIEDGKGDFPVTLGDCPDKGIGSIIEATANPSDGTKAVLMSIEKEFKAEDDAYRQAQVDKTEEGLFRDEENEEGRYGKIKKGK